MRIFNYIKKVMKILGYLHKKGEYKDIPYHNVILNVELKNENTVGICTEQIKIKHSKLIELLNESKIGLETLVGLDVNIYYDQFKNVIAIVKK